MFNPKQSQGGLTLEQKLAVRSVELQIAKMHPEDLRAFTLSLYESMLERQNIFNSLLKKDWGL